MIALNIPEPGWQIFPSGTPPRRVQVFGERSSGTNFVKRLIGRNTSVQPIEDLGWKHGFAQMAAIPEDVLIVAVVRDARAWALSMHAKPWHTPSAMQRLEFTDFLRTEWATIADRPRYFPQVAALGGTGRPLQQDRHPITGRAFANLFALRRAKLAGVLGFFQRDCAFVLVRLESLQAAPEAFIDALTATLDLTRPHPDFRPVVRRLGAKFKPSVQERPATPDSFPAAALPLLHATLDLDVEGALGYHY
ncbi:hypothetical protein [Puniceibacterium sp. IMCC21224]|uniref:hypothetical protein n=1 Tax=Puniceibacterium sp. IMCC21224 TaxID=1618204 RepID=UPI00064D844A|nr:hypothetical protein [Puniceibacterium sp. IMCC21224]KMK67528.1 hypothetical protein IMCC21224_112399 [Puniceibacterium sp. IMCC21224]